MLIVEGPDGSGKSTLIRRLTRDLNLPIAPRVVGADTEARVDLAQWTEENIDRGFQRTIFDRHRMISEPIYGPILRPRQTADFLDLGWMSDMTWRFYALKPVIIYCLPHMETVWRNVMDPRTNNAKVNSREVTEALYAAYVSRATMDFSRGVGRLFNYEVTLYSDILRWAEYRLEEQDGRGTHAAATAG